MSSSATHDATYNDETGEITPTQEYSLTDSIHAFFSSQDTYIDTCDECRLYGITDSSVNGSCCKNSLCTSKQG
jgi:hypothetical protein